MAEANHLARRRGGRKYFYHHERRLGQAQANAPRMPRIVRFEAHEYISLPKQPKKPAPIAEKRARELLLSYLDPGQQFMLEKLGLFYERSKDGVLFALHDGYFLIEYDEGGPVRCLGIHTTPYVPPWFRGMAATSSLPLSDGLLAQVLMLRTNTDLLPAACVFAWSNFRVTYRLHHPQDILHILNGPALTNLTAMTWPG